LNISDATIDQMIGVVRAESQRLDKTYRSGAWHLDLAGKVAIGVEDGIASRIRRLASSFPNQRRVVVGCPHFVQGDSPDEIGQAIAGWLERI
jgi:pimeloyl-ACP methyl ester carboxylesterase